MPSPDYDDSQNPYRATIIDEKPVEAAEFFRAEPQYRKLVPGSVGRISYAMFMLHKWQFIGLGIAQGLFIVCPAIAVFWLLVQHPDMGRTQPWLPVVTAIILILLTVFMIVVSISVSLRVLRKEKMVFLSTLRDAARLAWCVLHSGIYMTAWLGILTASMTPVYLIWAYLADNWIFWNDYQLILGTSVGLLVTIAWIFALIFTLTRLFYGVHFIVDCNMSCLAALRACWRHTRGNIKTITFKKSGPFARQFGLLVFLYLTGGLGLAGYCYCDVTVTYLMLTGQCELLEELPDEW